MVKIPEHFITDIRARFEELKAMPEDNILPEELISWWVPHQNNQNNCWKWALLFIVIKASVSMILPLLFFKLLFRFFLFNWHCRLISLLSELADYVRSMPRELMDKIYPFIDGLKK